jgi:hypothetical protein
MLLANRWPLIRRGFADALVEISRLANGQGGPNDKFVGERSVLFNVTSVQIQVQNNEDPFIYR